MFVPFSVLSHRSVVFLVKEMSTSLISISEGRTSSYLFWLILVFLWPSLAEESWISSMAGCKSCSSMKIQEDFPPSGILCIPGCYVVTGEWMLEIWTLIGSGCAQHSSIFIFLVRQVGNWSETSKDVNVILVFPIMFSHIMQQSCYMSWVLRSCISNFSVRS